MKRLTPILVVFGVLLGTLGCTKTYNTAPGSGIVVVGFPAWVSEGEKVEKLKKYAIKKCGHAKFSLSRVITQEWNEPSDIRFSKKAEGKNAIQGYVNCNIYNPTIEYASTERANQKTFQAPIKRPKPKPVVKKKQKPKPKQVAKRTPPKKSPPSKTGTSGSGFFVSKSGHVITNQHIVSDCGKVTVGDNAKKQVTADVLETDRRNDLALLKISSTKMASVETKSLISKLGITVVPLASDGLLRSEDVELGERVLVAGYPYGEIFSNTIKVTGGMVSANRGLGDDTGQFQMDAAVQPGNSGGPIYDENGNIVGVVISQLNKRKFEKIVGSIPENVNFGIKASTVRQFLTASGLPTKWSKRSKRMSTKQLAKIAKNQTVMVVCHP
jgi:S1-C subfamily serine protease